MEKDAACSVSSKNQLSSFGILIGLLATGVEPICDAQDAFYLVLLVTSSCRTSWIFKVPSLALARS